MKESVNMSLAIRNGNEEDSNLFAKPYPKINENKSTIMIPIDGNEPKSKSLSDPISTTNIEKCYSKHHKASLEILMKKISSTTEKMQKTNLSIAERKQENALLKKQLRELEVQVEDMKIKYNALAKENEELKEKCTAFNRKYTSLESVYDKEFANMTAILNKQKSMVIHADHLRENLKTLEQEKQQMEAKLEALIRQKENQLAEFKSSNSLLQTRIVELEKLFDQFKTEAAAEKETLELNFKAQLDEYASQLERQIKDNEICENELQSTLNKLKDVEGRERDLQKLNQQLSIKLSDAEQSLTATIDQHRLEKEELLSHNEKLNLEAERNKSLIQELEESKRQLVASNLDETNSAQTQLNKLTNEIVVLRSTIDELQQKHLSISRNLEADNAELTKQLQALKQLHETELLALRDELQQKDAIHIEDQRKFTELEAEKNTTVAELLYKMKQIKNVFGLPINTAAVVANQQMKKKEINESLTSVCGAKSTDEAPAPSPTSSDKNIANIITEITAASVAPRQRRQAKRSYKFYNSDFNTDSDNTEDEPIPSKLIKKNKACSKKKSVSRVCSKQQSDAFDKLKNSSDP